MIITGMLYKNILAFSTRKNNPIKTPKNKKAAKDHKDFCTQSGPLFNAPANDDHDKKEKARIKSPSIELTIIFLFIR